MTDIFVTYFYQKYFISGLDQLDVQISYPTFPLSCAVLAILKGTSSDILLVLLISTSSNP